MFALMMPVMNIGMNGLTLAIYWLGAVLIQQIAPDGRSGQDNAFSATSLFSAHMPHMW